MVKKLAEAEEEDNIYQQDPSLLPEWKEQKKETQQMEQE
eukprot:CAMPEP_0206421980 /NCGR_PEP_ID=MMETSP0324_2-20121206/1782_1 /ASSEMBLY_ACC=CAM_ASM_000836 /TAXON_ID=2866 /ORGANISM="Crypthecodinium cohnii, Strain Seligo" /LENGTH=38 /DNA_ID= /DNA_START= /DNA_END= /DNA_ORIENTATION=